MERKSLYQKLTLSCKAYTQMILHNAAVCYNYIHLSNVCCTCVLITHAMHTSVHACGHFLPLSLTGLLIQKDAFKINFITVETKIPVNKNVQRCYFFKQLHLKHAEII